jgi:hypothetical protein
MTREDAIAYPDNKFVFCANIMNTLPRRPAALRTKTGCLTCKRAAVVSKKYAELTQDGRQEP